VVEQVKIMKKIAVMLGCALLLMLACKKESPTQQFIKPGKTKPTHFQAKSYGTVNDNLLADMANLVTVT
jgi:hypothetical protein